MVRQTRWQLKCSLGTNPCASKYSTAYNNNKNERSAKAAQQFMRLFVAVNEWEESKRKKNIYLFA